MDLTGEADGPPQKMGMAYADVFTGLYGVIAIQAALAEREKSGRGQHIDMALLDSMVGVLGNQAMNYLTTGQSPRRMGTAHPNIVPYQDFPVADGHLIIACGNDRQFARLCTILGLALTQDERFATNAARVQNRATLIELICERTRSHTRDNLLSALEEQGIPAGPINTVGQALQDEQIQQRGMVLDTGPAPGIRTPITFERSTLATHNAAPRLGADTGSSFSTKPDHSGEC